MKLQRRRALTLDPPRTRLYILCLFFAAGMLAGHLACRAVPSDDLTALRSYVMGYAQLSSEERGCAGLAQVVWVYFRYPAAAFLLGLWCILTGIDAHRHQETELLKNLVMAGGYFMLAIAGPGGWALF